MLYRCLGRPEISAWMPMPQAPRSAARSPGQVVLALLAALGHHARDLVELVRLQVVEREILELPLDARDAEAVRERCVDLHRLARLLDAPLRRQLGERAHVVQPVGELEAIYVTEPVKEGLPIAYNQLISKDEITINAKIESELAALSTHEQREYLAEYGFKESGLERLIKAGYQKLKLQSFLTAGEIECRAWTLRQGDTALRASGVIHTDFMKKFIKADVIDWQEFVRLGGWKKAREVGAVRSEGRDYVMKDGEVVEFKIG